MEPGDRPTILIIGHDVTRETVLVQAGTFATWAQARGFAVEPRVSGEAMPDPRAVAAVAVLGSMQGAWDDAVPWLAGEIAYLTDAVGADTPVLGMCFGGQILARVLGGHVQPGPGSENGWYDVTSEAPEVIAGGPWMEFHFDTFVTPPGAQRLASSPLCDQAFRSGVHVGVQFHPEITPAEFETWAARWRGTELEARLPELGVDPDALRAETAERAEVSRRNSWVLFDDFADRAGLRAGAAA